MFARAKTRFKDGRRHRCWSVVENHRNRDGRVVQRQVLYLGEINGSQRAAWRRSIEVIDGDTQSRQMALFASGREAPELSREVVRARVADLAVHRPRQWGARWLALVLWDRLELDRFWRPRLPASRQGTRWLDALKTQVCCRLIEPGSEWRLHRHWHEHSAMADLPGGPRVLAKDAPHRCPDKLPAHRRALFSHLGERWQTLFEARFDVLLHDLTSTCFESDAPFDGLRRHGCSRDRRSDCVQVATAPIVTPRGFPLACEAMPGNTGEKTTLADFLTQVEQQCGRSERVWIMDRGIPTEETLSAMRAADTSVHCLVGTPKGRLTKLERRFPNLPWRQVREAVDAKLLAEDDELYILARSRARILKERGMRRRRPKKLWRRLHELRRQAPRRDQLPLRLGAAKKEAGRAWHLVAVRLPDPDEEVSAATFSFALRRDKLRQVRRREGRCLLRSNLASEDPATLWRCCMQLAEVEQAFKELKRDLALRPVFRPLDRRIEAHIFVAFLACCLQVTLKNLARRHAPGLTPRAVLEKFAALQMVDAHLPTTDGRHLVLPRHTQPTSDHRLLLRQLDLQLPEQPPPRIAS